jgi:hypothetical protein
MGHALRVLLAYVDESGDSGYAGSMTYTLGCVLVEANDWPDRFDGFLAFRRFLRTQFGILMREEIKANYLIRGGGPLTSRGFGDQIRHDIYRQHMRLAPKLGLDVFAVVIEKQKIRVRRNPRDIAWEFLLQRFERMGTEDGQRVMVVHDEGDALAVRGLVRKARRASTAGSAFGLGRLYLPARLIIDDPVSRDSGQSYFIQLSDLAAYAAFRTVHPPPPQRSPVCPASMWDELGGARFADANRLATGVLGRSAARGIVVWPA